MEPKKSKYDTNPLDPDYVRKTEEVWAEGDRGAPTQEVKGATHEIGSSANEAAKRDPYSEAPTRRYDKVPLQTSYPSVFVPPTYSPPTPYQPSPAPFRTTTSKPNSRSIPGIGLPEKWAEALPYAPFFIGVVVSLIELFLVPRSEPRVRFHAAQGLAIHMAIVVVHMLFGVVAAITNTSIGGTLFSIAATIFLVVSMIRVFKGQPHHIPPVSELGQWLNEHITPRTKS